MATFFLHFISFIFFYSIIHLYLLIYINFYQVLSASLEKRELKTPIDSRIKVYIINTMLYLYSVPYGTPKYHIARRIFQSHV